MDSQTMMQRLVDQLNEANRHYYVLDKPIMPDREWDLLYDELKAWNGKRANAFPIPPPDGWAAIPCLHLPPAPAHEPAVEHGRGAVNCSACPVVLTGSRPPTPGCPVCRRSPTQLNTSI